MEWSGNEAEFLSGLSRRDYVCLFIFSSSAQVFSSVLLGAFYLGLGRLHL